MDMLHAVFLGIVEGITEFLPISSTFHLIWVSKILGISQTNFTKLFDVFIQAGAILSVLFIYGNMLRKDTELMKKVIIAFIPTAIIGFLLYKMIKNIFFANDILMLSVFIGIGIIFLLYELLWNKKKHTRLLQSFSYKEAFIIGVVQSFAVIPGVSRAGAVILGMLLLRFKRDESAKFSFLLALPTIISASLFDLFKMRQVVEFSSNNVTLLVIGFVTAFVTAYISITWFIRSIEKYTLSLFGIYRIIAGSLLAVIK